jgi:hypothetical protein
MAEKNFYDPITKHLGELLSAVASGFCLETVATKGLTERAKQAIPQGREIVFAFMKDRPDIIGVVDGQFSKHLLVAEVKENSPTLEDIYQIKRYKEVFEARYAFLITVGPIKEELKRLCRNTPTILRSLADDSFRFLVLAQFWPGTAQFIDWFAANPFEQDFYWKS